MEKFLTFNEFELIFDTFALDSDETYKWKDICQSKFSNICDTYEDLGFMLTMEAYQMVLHQLGPDVDFFDKNSNINLFVKNNIQSKQFHFFMPVLTFRMQAFIESTPEIDIRNELLVRLNDVRDEEWSREYQAQRDMAAEDPSNNFRKRRADTEKDNYKNSKSCNGLG